jgi:dolichol kinase
LWPALTGWAAFRLSLLIGTPLVLGLDWLRIRQPVFATALQSAVPVFRPPERDRLSGAAWLWAGFAAAAWFVPEAATAGILAGALGDPAAALAGSRWGGGTRKSWPGTMAAIAVSGLAILAAGAPAAVALWGGVTAGVLERWSGPLDDNLTMAPGVAALVALLS